MSYRFPLSPVLRVRELAAEQEERTLARILAEIEQLRAALTRNAAEQRDTALARQKILASAALPAMHLHAFHATAQDLRAREQQLRKQLAAFEQLRLEQTARYREAYQKREVLESLRAQGQTAWHAAERRREEKTADEAFLNKFARSR